MTKNDIVTALLAEVEHDESVKDARAKAIKKERQKILQEQMAEERRETLRAWRAWERAQERADERERQKKANAQLQAYFVKADADDRASFLETYNLLYDINEEAIKKGTRAHFPKILENFDFPFTQFVYTEDEKAGLPLILMDRGSMDFFLKMGLWLYKKNPLTELVDELKALNEPQETASVDPAILLEIIKLDPFIFSTLGRR